MFFVRHFLLFGSHSNFALHLKRLAVVYLFFFISYRLITSYRRAHRRGSGHARTHPREKDWTRDTLCVLSIAMGNWEFEQFQFVLNCPVCFYHIHLLSLFFDFSLFLARLEYCVTFDQILLLLNAYNRIGYLVALSHKQSRIEIYFSLGMEVK